MVAVEMCKLTVSVCNSAMLNVHSNNKTRWYEQPYLMNE